MFPKTPAPDSQSLGGWAVAALLVPVKSQKLKERRGRCSLLTRNSNLQSTLSLGSYRWEDPRGPLLVASLLRGRGGTLAVALAT